MLTNAPLVVLLAIEPRSYSVYQVVRVAGPQLIAGNTVLQRHSKVCPIRPSP